MELALLTVPRGFPYVVQTLASMYLAGGPERAWLINGSTDESHLAALKHHAALTIVSMSEAEHAAISGWSVQRRIAANFVRALTLLPEGEDLVIAEDDIVVSDGWWERARAMCDAAKRQHGRFLLLLFSPDVAADDGSGYGLYRGAMYGGQLVCVPASLRASLAAFVWRTCVVGDARAHDACLRDYCGTETASLLAASKSLAQHVGSVSTHANLRHLAPRSATFGHLASEDVDF